MSSRPNILFLMTDQMQGRVLEPGHVCQTPHLDRVIDRGLRFGRAYTTNPVCSPARASLMTGLLPHNHGVLEVIHTVDPDQSCLRTDKPHWAQRLQAAGYRTGYFGKWHVERSDDLTRFGWQTDGGSASPLFKEHRAKVLGGNQPQLDFSLVRHNDRPPGYRKTVLYGVTDRPPEKRPLGVTVSLAHSFLEEAVKGSDPWCCFVSLTEPHDPFIAGQEAFGLYDVDAIELAPNVHDDLAGRPAIYRKVGRTWAGMKDREKKEAAACYYASITEIDRQFGRLLTLLETSGRAGDTVVVVTSDHGELLGAHGLYCKNYTASEEVYNIPLVMAGPGIAAGAATGARVGIHDLCPTLLELAGAASIDAPDSRSFAAVLRDPESAAAGFSTGFAENEGSRYRLTQRVVWDGPWKYVHNGFDYDELYNLDDDPYEMKNLAADPAYEDRVIQMMTLAWRYIRDTGDHTLFNTHYPILRLGPVGPLVLDE